MRRKCARASIIRGIHNCIRCGFPSGDTREFVRCLTSSTWFYPSFRDLQVFCTHLSTCRTPETAFRPGFLVVRTSRQINESLAAAGGASNDSPLALVTSLTISYSVAPDLLLQQSRSCNHMLKPWLQLLTARNL